MNKAFRRRIPVVVVLAAGLSVGCGDNGNNGPDSGNGAPTADAGVNPDAGSTADGGPQIDAGPGADAGSTTDAGTDAGSTADAGPGDAGGAPDAGGIVDAGGADAGLDAGGPDAGNAGDAGGPDAGDAGDAGGPDAGDAAVDAGGPDAGDAATDAGGADAGDGGPDAAVDAGSGLPPVITRIAWRPDPAEECEMNSDSNMEIFVMAEDPDSENDDLYVEGSLTGCFDAFSGVITEQPFVVSCPQAGTYRGTVTVSDLPEGEGNTDTETFLVPPCGEGFIEPEP